MWKINSYLFNKKLDQLISKLEADDGKPFSSLSESNKFYNEEGYKYKIYDKARDTLELNDWEKSQIGSGELLSKVISSMKVTVRHNGKLQNNNLVIHQGYTKKIEEFGNIKDYDLEKAIFDLFKSGTGDEAVFEVLTKYTGQFKIVTFLFFLKNYRKYMPVSAPRNFDKILDDISQREGENDKLSNNCDWIAYSNFLKLLYESRDLIEERLNEKISLLDVHSVLWMFKNLDEKEDKDNIIFKELELVELPELNKKNDKKGKNASFSAKDREDTDSRKRSFGKEAVGAVMEYLSKNRPGEAKDVSEQDLSLGYDIEYKEDGKPKECIEVKATNNKSRINIYLSANELDKGLKIGENYYLYIVSNMRGTKTINSHKNPFNEKLKIVKEAFKAKGNNFVMADPQSVKLILKINNK